MYRKTDNTIIQKRPGQNINFVVSGFDEQTLISVSDIQACLSQIPGDHMKGLKSLKYLGSNRSIYPHLASTPKHFGEYVQAQRTINIYNYFDKNEFTHILFHEIGHHVFHTLLSAERRYEWTNRIYPGSAYITSYAKTSTSEDFAECYAHYLTKKEKLTHLPRKLHFLNTYIFT